MCDYDFKVFSAQVVFFVCFFHFSVLCVWRNRWFIFQSMQLSTQAASCFNHTLVYFPLFAEQSFTELWLCYKMQVTHAALPLHGLKILTEELTRCTANMLLLLHGPSDCCQWWKIFRKKVILQCFIKYSCPAFLVMLKQLNTMTQGRITNSKEQMSLVLRPSGPLMMQNHHWGICGAKLKYHSNCASLVKLTFILGLVGQVVNVFVYYISQGGFVFTSLASLLDGFHWNLVRRWGVGWRSKH